MTTVVVIGAAGFMGRHLVECLIKEGVATIPVSRRPLPGYIQVADYRESPPGDLLIHLAEEPDRGAVNNLGDDYINDAANLTSSLASRFAQKMIYVSSGLVYGADSEAPCKVSASVIGSDTYTKSKLTNERIVLDACGCVIRFSNILGSGMSSNNVCSDIIRQIPGSGPLFVRDDGPVRDFLSVSDAVTALTSLVKSRPVGILNVGSGIGVSIRQLAETALALAGESSREIIATSPFHKPLVNILDISETTKVTGWKPVVSLQEELVKLIQDKVAIFHE